MMGPGREAQVALFYEFSLKDHVRRNHLLRSIDRFVDLSSIRAHLTGFYSHTINQAGRVRIDQNHVEAGEFWRLGPDDATVLSK